MTSWKYIMETHGVLLTAFNWVGQMNENKQFLQNFTMGFLMMPTTIHIILQKFLEKVQSSPTSNFYEHFTGIFILRDSCRMGCTF